MWLETRNTSKETWDVEIPDDNLSHHVQEFLGIHRYGELQTEIPLKKQALESTIEMSLKWVVELLKTRLKIGCAESITQANAR